MRSINRVLLLPYYNETHPVRKEELDFCVSLNQKTFDAVSVVSENAEQPDWFGGELHFWRNQSSPPTMQDFADLIKLFEGWVSTRTNLFIIANADIIIDSRNLDLIQRNLAKEDVFCLTRWELSNQKLWNVNYSQDAWAFWNGFPEHFDYSIPLAQPGFDNRLTYEFAAKGRNILNPSKDIKIWHNHQSKVVTDKNSQKYRVPLPYLFIDPHRIGEKSTTTQPTHLPKKSIRDKERRVKGRTI